MSKLKLIIIICAVALVVIVCGVFLFQVPRNNAIELEEQIKTAFSNVEVQQKRRADLIPNLVDCVKAYDEHEYTTLMDIINARGTSSDEAVDEVQNILSVVAEAYPELKSNETYQNLMNGLSITENLIAEYRNNYNKQVKNYRSYTKKFPANIILGMTGYDINEYSYLEFDTSAYAPTNLFD